MTATDAKITKITSTDSSIEFDFVLPGDSLSHRHRQIRLSLNVGGIYVATSLSHLTGGLERKCDKLIVRASGDNVLDLRFVPIS